MSREGSGSTPSEPYRDILAAGPPTTRPETTRSTEPRSADDASPSEGPEVTVVVPGELSTRPYPGVGTPADDPGAERARPLRGTRPRFGRYYGLATWLLLGVGFLAVLLVLAVDEAITDWDVEVPMGRAVELDLPPAQTRWVWVPEEHVGAVECTATDGSGADLPMSPLGGGSHEDYEATFRFPTGDGAVTLTCAVAADPTAQPAGATVWVGEPDDDTYRPVAEMSVLLLLGGPGLGVALFVVTLLVQIVSAVAYRTSPRRPVNLNTATATELTTLPGIGPARAGRIVAWRDRNGPFTAADDLVRVPGVGTATVRRLRSRTTV